MLPTTLEIIREVLNITANNKKHGQGMRYCQPCTILGLFMLFMFMHPLTWNPWHHRVTSPPPSHGYTTTPTWHFTVHLSAVCRLLHCTKLFLVCHRPPRPLLISFIIWALCFSIFPLPLFPSVLSYWVLDLMLPIFLVCIFYVRFLVLLFFVSFLLGAFLFILGALLVFEEKHFHSLYLV